MPADGGTVAMTTESGRNLPRLFISYRRDDTGGDAGRLHETLTELLGPDRTFCDLDQIAPGIDFEVALKNALSASEVVLVLIGPNWESISDSNGKPRLSNKRDLVRMELLEALKNEKVRIVPTLLNRNTVPKKADLPNVLRPIARLNAFLIRRERWRDDVAALLKRLGITQEKAIRQSRLVSATVEWKRKDEPDPTPRRWVVYVDNDSDDAITVEEVKVSSPSMKFSIKDWGTVRPKSMSDYELEESDFDPFGDRPEVHLRFSDSYGQRWTWRRGSLKPIASAPKPARRSI
jgi:hypothetical protein